MSVKTWGQIVALRIVTSWQQRSECCAPLRRMFGYKMGCLIFALSASVSTGLLHAADQEIQLPQNGVAQELSAESLNDAAPDGEEAEALDEEGEAEMNPLSFEAFDSRARVEAASRAQRGPKPYMSVEGVTMKATNLSDPKESNSDVNTASSGSRSETDD